MIVTLTANPSLDRTVTLGEPLLAGEVQSALSSREDAGGKGINVARVIAAAGVPALAVLPLAEDDPFALSLASTGVAARTVPISGHARANLTITDPDGTTTKLNLPGPHLTADDVAAVIAAVVAAVEGAHWLVLAGSLPPGAGAAFYVQVIRAVRRRWGADAPRIAVDTSGEPLRVVVAEGAPDLIKPNDEELAELAGISLADEGDLALAVLPVARTIVPSRVGSALVTLGARGAVFVDADGAWAAEPPRVRVVSTVGAGDSSLAGYLLAEIASEEQPGRVRRAVRYGSAAASLPGTQAPAPADLPTDDVSVRTL